MDKQTVTAAERRNAIEAIVRQMEDAIHEAMSEARDALDRIGVPDGPLDPADREALERRFDAALEVVPGAEPFEPTPFGENVLMTMVTLAAVATAPEGAGVAVYEKCEGGLIDELMADLKTSVVSRVATAMQAPASV